MPDLADAPAELASRSPMFAQALTKQTKTTQDVKHLAETYLAMVPRSGPISNGETISHRPDMHARHGNAFDMEKARETANRILDGAL